jgi:hypothetical protein
MGLEPISLHERFGIVISKGIFGHVLPMWCFVAESRLNSIALLRWQVQSQSVRLHKRTLLTRAPLRFSLFMSRQAGF